jgi:HK97 family phage major capsid protein
MAAVNVRELLHERQALRVQKEALGKEGLALMDAAQAEKRSMTADEQKRVGEIEAQVDGMNSRLEQLDSEIELRDKFSPTAAKPDPAIGMAPADVQRYSFVRAIRAAMNKDWRGAELEREASEATAKALGITPRGFLVPNDVMAARALARVRTDRGFQYIPMEMRDLVKGTTTAGGYTVATDLLAQSFIELLRNKMMVQAAGATMLGDLVGDVAIPSQTGGATAYWVTEGNAPTESQQTVGQVPMTPKTVGAFTDISRKLLKQTSIDVEGFVRNDLAAICALAIDLAALSGTGASGQPTGVSNTSGIGAVFAGGAADDVTNPNGAAPVWADFVNLESAVAAANADLGALAYFVNAKTRGFAKKTVKFANTADTLWDTRAGNTPVNGYPAFVTNQVRGNLTKGAGSSLSEIFFGNWADLIMGLWGTLDVLVDPYTGGTAGTVRVIALQDVDVAVRHAASFAQGDDFNAA